MIDIIALTTHSQVPPPRALPALPDVGVAVVDMVVRPATPAPGLTGGVPRFRPAEVSLPVSPAPAVAPLPLALRRSPPRR